MKTIRSLFILAIFLFATVACEEEPEVKDAPAIPPVGSFVMDFSDFSNSDDTTATFPTDKDVLTFVNWGHAYFNVAVWNFIITAGMIIPVASFVESFNHEAIYHPNEDNWTWSYNFNANGLHEAELTGYLESDSVIWEMRIDDFLWYFGHSHLNASGGYWILNKNQNEPFQLLKIDWNNVSDEVSDIRYMNVEPDGAENGGYIHYGKVNEEFDRFYDIYNKGQDKLTEIEWLYADKSGRVKEFRRFGDYEWHCWDSTLNDIPCN